MVPWHNQRSPMLLHPASLQMDQIAAPQASVDTDTDEILQPWWTGREELRLLRLSQPTETFLAFLIRCEWVDLHGVTFCRYSANNSATVWRCVGCTPPAHRSRASCTIQAAKISSAAFRCLTPVFLLKRTPSIFTDIQYV